MRKPLKFVFALVLFFVILLFTTKLEYTTLTKGTITVEIIDIEDNVLNSKEIKYKNGDRLSSLLKENFENVRIEEGFIYAIDKLDTPSDFSHFISIYVDGEMSELGLESLPFKDGMVISFKDTKYISES